MKSSRSFSSNFIKVILFILLLVLIYLGLALAFTGTYVRTHFPNASFNQLLFNLQQPTDTANPKIIRSIVTGCLIQPAFLAAAVFLFILLIYKLYPWKRESWLAAFGSALIILAGGFWNAVTGCHIDDWLASLNDRPALYDHFYTDPSLVTFNFPDQKRNLIYIYLESMERTYMDIEHGGVFETSLMPELEKLEEDNDVFSSLGMSPVSALNWTMSSLTAQSAGINIQPNPDQDQFDDNEKILPGAYSLGDILDKEGYKQIFLMGSDANYASRSTFFKDHGNYEMRDYYWALDQGLIEEGYYENWGYEDAKLFDYAKETLNELSKTGKPFNLTILTADTHFYDGYLCEDCGDEFDIQYENVIACSSKRVAAFIKWCKKQPWYENTTIVLTGDHLTVDTVFDDMIPEGYERKIYSIIINPAKTPPKTDRAYSALDMFPSTLSALGIEYASDRLGLGTDLYKEAPTLLEIEGEPQLASGLFSPGDFYTERLEHKPY